MIQTILDKISGKIPPGAKRSGKWSAVRALHLASHPSCTACGGTKKLEVHHIAPFHTNPLLELEPSNLITLCELGKNGIVCHLAIGHLGNYKTINPVSPEDAQWWGDKIKGRDK